MLPVEFKAAQEGVVFCADIECIFFIVESDGFVVFIRFCGVVERCGVPTARQRRSVSLRVNLLLIIGDGAGRPVSGPCLGRSGISPLRVRDGASRLQTQAPATVPTVPSV